MSERARVAVLTVSDRCARSEATDEAGPAVIALVERQLQADIINRACVEDDPDEIAARIRGWASGESPPDLILTTGGTGLGPRDVTPEATRRVIERPSPGLMELARHRCGERTPLVYLSRGEAGTIGRTLVINLPGSTRGATECLEALLDVLPHAVAMLHGGDHPRRARD